MAPNVKSIFTASESGAPVVQVKEVQALAGVGLAGDRYALKLGKTRDEHSYDVTLIDESALRYIEESTGIKTADGEHRRNIVVEGVDLRLLVGRRFQIGEAILAYGGPKPPCKYLERITEPGMFDALEGRAGIGANILISGWIRQGDTLKVLPTQTDATRETDDAL